MLPCKVPCSYCGRRFYPERLKVHLRFFCGPNAQKSAAQAKQQKKRPKGEAPHAAAALVWLAWLLWLLAWHDACCAGWLCAGSRVLLLRGCMTPLLACCMRLRLRLARQCAAAAHW
jgi:hypothetical protein